MCLCKDAPWRKSYFYVRTPHVCVMCNVCVLSVLSVISVLSVLSELLALRVLSVLSVLGGADGPLNAGEAGRPLNVQLTPKLLEC